MGKCYLSQQDRFYTKSEEKKIYEELFGMITEWLDMYYSDKKDIFVDKILSHKYKLMRNFLRKIALQDVSLDFYIKQLPQIWILKPYLLEILCLFCWVLSEFSNEYFFKIYTEISFSLIGSAKIDLIYIIMLHIFAVTYIVLFHRRNLLYLSLKDKLSEVRIIVWRRILLKQYEINNNINIEGYEK